MIHDPLCPLCGMTTIDLVALKGLSKRTLRRIQASRISCQCDLIAKVREDASSAAELEAWRDVYETIKDGHRGNGSAFWDICCQICQEIECDNDCPVGESVDREARAYNQGQRNMLAKCIAAVGSFDDVDEIEFILASLRALQGKP